MAWFMVNANKTSKTTLTNDINMEYLIGKTAHMVFVLNSLNYESQNGKRHGNWLLFGWDINLDIT